MSNFDVQFTGGGETAAGGGGAVTRTPTDKLLLMNVDAEQFAEFSYVNPEFVVTV